jgi:hypothetical protein
MAMAGAAMLAGAAAVTAPGPAKGVATMALLTLFAFRAPVAQLLLLVAMTAIVPLGVLARFGSGGTVNNAGVLPSDCMLIAALIRALVVLPWTPLPARARWAVGVMSAFYFGVCLQVGHAIVLGRPLSGVGSEFRTLLALGTMLAAAPLVADPGSRRRLLRGLLIVGLAVGVWGIVQFALGLRFDAPDGNSSVASFLTAGRVVGLLVFPIAAVVSLAVVTGAPPRSRVARALLLATFAANMLAIVLTFERTVLLAAAVGCALVFVRGTAAQRIRMLAWASPVLAVGLAAVALASPAVLPAYAQRLASLTALQTDPSAVYRRQEAEVIGQQIAAHPVAGSGLGAAILIGRPGTNRPLVLRRFAENGYQWLAWKLGIPIAAMLCVVFALALLARGGRWESPDEMIVRRACQAALAALALVMLTFSAASDFESTPAIGLIAALALARTYRPDASR